MVKKLAPVLLGLWGLVCGACRTMEPPYRVEDVAFDAKLLGTWVQESPPPKKDSRPWVMHVEARDVTVRNARLFESGPLKGPVKDGEGAARDVARAYTIRMEPEQPGEQDVELYAYLLRSRGRTFVGVQASPEKLGLLSGFAAIPVHVLWLCDRTEDRLTVRAPKTPVAWVPGLRSLDSPAGRAPDVPSKDKLRGEGIPFTQDVDRLLRIYGAYADDPSFWEGATAYRRVGE